MSTIGVSVRGDAGAGDGPADAQGATACARAFSNRRPRSRLRAVALLTFASCLSLGAFGSTAAPAGAAGISADVVMQSIDSCQQGLGGGLFALQGGSYTQPVFAAPGAHAPQTVGSGQGCPLQQGNCVASQVGCVTFPAVPPGTYTIRWSRSAPANLPGNPDGYAGCTGGSACRSEVINLTVSAKGTVTAHTTNTYPDNTPVTWPNAAPHTAYAATDADPAVFHSFGLGSGSCDGDGDADDHLTGTPSSHCPFLPESDEATMCPGRTYPWECGNAIVDAGTSTTETAPTSTGAGSAGTSAVVAVRGADRALWVHTDAHGYLSYGGGLTAAPAVAPLGGGNHLYVVAGDDHQLYQRTDALGYRPAAPAGTSCLDNPAVYVSGSGATIACMGADHGLFVNHGSVDGNGVLHYGAWLAEGGYLHSGPSIALVQGALHYFVEGSNHAEFDRTDATPYVATPWGCIGHAGVANLGAEAYFSCHGTDGQGWVAVNSGTGWGGARPLGGRIVDGTAVAAHGGGATVAVVGLDGGAYTTEVDTAGGVVIGWRPLGGECFFGTGAVAE